LIARVERKLVAKDLDSLEVMTSGGVAYELTIPLSVYETLPRLGEDITLHTSLVVKEDSWQLFGFASVFEKRLFEKLLTANGVGPALAIGLLSALSANRLIRAIREKDIPTLQSVPRVGRRPSVSSSIWETSSMGSARQRAPRRLRRARRLMTPCAPSYPLATRALTLTGGSGPHLTLAVEANPPQS